MTKGTLTALIALFTAAVATLVVFSCSIESPEPSADRKETKFTHANFTDDNACTECHEEDRPSPKHGAGVDCKVCHESSDDKSPFVPLDGITSSGDQGENTATTSDTSTATENDPTKVHEHPAGLTSCVACHEKDRAPPPHVASGDCAACHEPSNVGGPWKPK